MEYVDPQKTGKHLIEETDNCIKRTALESVLNLPKLLQITFYSGIDSIVFCIPPVFFN